MARRQMEIKGTERDSIPEIEDAAETWRERRKDAKAAKEREKEAQYALIAIMGAHKKKKYKYNDPDGGDEILLSIDQEPKVSAKKTGEAESEIGEGIDTGAPRISTPGVHAGLIAEAAEKSGGDPHVEVTSDGDVVVPEASVPKKKRGSKARN